METPNDLAGNLTEEIMVEIAPYVNNYNKVYSRLYELVKPYTDANEKCLEVLKNYVEDGNFYGDGFYKARNLLDRLPIKNNKKQNNNKK